MSHFPRQRQRAHLWALRLFLFNQNTWKGRSVCFSPRISLTDVMIKFALPMWPPKLTAVASGNSWTQASGNSWTQGRPTDPKESRASPSWPLFLQRKLESHTPILPLTRAGAWPRLSSSQSHYVHEHQVPWQDCPALLLLIIRYMRILSQCLGPGTSARRGPVQYVPGLLPLSTLKTALGFLNRGGGGDRALNCFPL